MKVIFRNQKEFGQFYTEIKRSLFQTNFQEKYQIISKLGSGKTGQVFEVKDKSSGMVYAAKLCSNVLISSLSDFFFNSKVNSNS